MADQIQLDAAQVQLVYGGPDQIEADSLGLQLVYDLVGKLQVDGALVQLVYVSVLDIPAPASLRSLSRMEAIAADLPSLRSLSTMAAIPTDRLGTMQSPSLMQPLLLAIPPGCQSRSRMQDIPVFNSGLFLNF